MDPSIIAVTKNREQSIKQIEVEPPLAHLMLSSSA